MGNLYTQYKSQPSYRITLLYKLKIEWGNNPRNYSKIRQLQKELARWERKLVKGTATSEYKSV